MHSLPTIIYSILIGQHTDDVILHHYIITLTVTVTDIITKCVQDDVQLLVNEPPN